VSASRSSVLGLCALVLLGCGDATMGPGGPTTPTAAPPTPSVAAGTDPGARPTLSAPKPFDPPAATVFTTAKGIQVWLLERHTLPVVSVTLAVPHGSARDPEDKPGLAYIAAGMLDEGAGKRNALELSSAVNDLGATLSVDAGVDGSFASLSVLKKNFKPAFELLADVVARPRFDAKEWKRVSQLWQNDLAKRADDPSSVSRVASSAAVYGAGTPYGHPSDGLLRGARKIDLAAAKAFYQKHWRPESSVLVVVGDVTRAEVEQLVTASLGDWTAPASAGPAPAVAAPESKPPAARPRLVLVDRRDAPQSVIAVVRDGVRASDPQAPLLDLVNNALGGSFTSRLNQNLREDHGWSYGARSGFTEVRGQGSFVARAAVHTEVTGPALKEMLREIDKMATEGLTADELKKVLAQDRGDMVQTYETVSGISRRLGTLASLGLPPGFDKTAGAARQGATLPRLAELARAHLPTKEAVVIVVGPRDKVAPALAGLGLGEPVLWDAEGAPVAAAGATAPPTKTPAPPASPTAAPKK
jgi:zinc protease